MKRYLFRFTVLLLSAALLLVPAGCSDPAKSMSFDEAMAEYEWDDSEVMFYILEEYTGHELLDIIWEEYGGERVMEWILDGGSDDLVLDAVADRYTIREFIDHQ